MKKAILLWSGGKASCLALYELRRTRECEMAGLLTTCTETDDRVSMHAVPLALIEEQAAQLKLPLHIVRVPQNPSNETYEARMAESLLRLREQGVELVAAGDIFLEDLRAYRERQWNALGLTGVFPLWKKDTTRLAREFVANGFHAITICVDSRVLGREYVGGTVDEKFLASLPPDADPCGENGEFHTFVFDAPFFAERMNFTRGVVTFRDPFWFCEIAP